MNPWNGMNAIILSGSGYAVGGRHKFPRRFRRARPPERPLRDRLWQGQRPHEVGEIAGQRVQLKTHRIGGERAASQTRPLGRVYELAINVKAAEALGLTMPLGLLRRADGVFE